MRHVLFFLLFFLFSSQALAQDFAPQVQTVVGAVQERTDHLATRASTHLFWIPSDHAMVFVYAGVIYTVNKHFWIAPQTGATINWNNEGDISPLGAVWTRMSSKQMALFLDLELYPMQDDLVYYGYYNAEYAAAPWLGVGLQAEQVDLGLIAGLHLTFIPSEQITLGPEYYYDIEGEQHILRWVMSITLK